MSDQQRNVLYIAYYFPPLGLSGVQRTLKFVKYLPSYGWKPTVLTVGPTGYYAFDESLLREIEEAQVDVIRTGSLDINRMMKGKRPVRMPSEGLRKILQFFGDLFLIPDSKIGWKRKAVKAASELLRTKHFDAIVATAPPQTDFLIGYILKKRFKVPLVLDYRDAWLEYPFKYFPTPLHRILHRRMERRVVHGCDRVVVTHRRVKENLVKRYSFLTYHDVMIISQGFDAADLGDVAPRPNRAGKMTIVHTGTFYAGRSPSVLLHALHNILKASPKMRGRIDLRLVGTTRREDQTLVRKLGLQNDVSFLGYLEHHACVKHLQEADVLWFVLDNDYQSPGKLYEYFGVRKPILGSVVDGYMKQLLLESKAGICVNIESVAEHEAALTDLVERFDAGTLPRPSGEFVSRFDRKTLTGELAKTLETLMDIDHNAFVKVEEGGS